MDDLGDTTKTTAADLVALHNRLCQPDERIVSEWKKSKGQLLDRIRALDEPVPIDGTREAAKETEDRPRRTVAEVAAELLADPSLNYSAIVERVRAELPWSRTTRRSLASLASRIRRAGKVVPKRR